MINNSKVLLRTFSIKNLEKIDDHWLLYFASIDADWVDFEDSRRDWLASKSALLEFSPIIKISSDLLDPFWYLPSIISTICNLLFQL